ncbi:MAG: ABC transporter substrate-binding protein [Patescibacteria group bacterium]
MKKQIWIPILIVIIILGIILIVQNQNSDQIDESKEPIKIGALLPLTGQISLLGEELKNGISLAVEDINANNKTKLEVIYEDSKVDPKEGVSAINKLIDVDGVNYVHVAATPIITAVQPITEEKKVVMTGTSISPSILENTNYTLRVFYNLEQSLVKFTEFINQNNYSQVAVLYQSGDAWENQVDSLENSGIKFKKKEIFNSGEKDFRTMLIKIKDSNPDLIIVLGYGSHFSALFQQIEELGMDDTKVLGGLDFLEVPQENLSLYKNAVFTVPSFNISPTKKSKDFIQKYEERFGKKPTHQAAYVYDAVNLYYLGLINTDGSSSNIMAYLQNLDYYDGVVGQIEILSNGDTKSSLTFATYKNGEVIPYE